MSGALELMQIGVAQGIERAARVIPPDAQVDYRPYLSQMELSTLVRRANGEDMLAFDQTMMRHGINPDEHEDRMQQSIASILKDAARESLPQADPDITVQHALRSYQPKSVEHLKVVGLAVSEAAWSDDPTVQTNGAVYLGVLGIGASEAKDAPYGSDGRPLSEIKAQILAESLTGKEIDAERLRAIVGQISDNYDWDVQVTRLNKNKLDDKAKAAIVIAAAVGSVGIINPASAESNYSGSSPIVVAGLPQEQSAVVAIDQQPLAETIVTTPQITAKPKITIIKAGTSIDQPISPAQIPVQTITTQEAQVSQQPTTTVPQSETVPENVPVVAAADTPQEPVIPQNSSEVTLPSQPIASADVPVAPVPATMPTAESQSSDTATPSPESLPVATAENIDALDVQVQLGDQLIAIVQAGVKAKSYAVLQGGEAKPNDKSDQMSDSMIGTCNGIIDWLNKARANDPETLKTFEAGWEKWRDAVLNDPDRFSQDERDQVQLVETQIQLYELNGDHDKAVKLGVLTTLNNILQQVITNPALYTEHTITATQKKPPVAQETTGKNPYKNYKLNDAQLNIVDEVAAQRNWKDWQKQMFVDTLERAVQIAYTKHINPAIAVSQAVLESGDFKSKLAKDQHNLFGMKGTGNAGSKSLPTSEWRNGAYVKIHDKFASFLDAGDSLEHYASTLLQRPWFADARSFFRSPSMYVLGLENALDTNNGNVLKYRSMAYATSPTYEKNTLALNNQLRLPELMPSDFFLSANVAKDMLTKHLPEQAKKVGAHPGLVSYFSQRDAKWASKEFNYSTIESSGCGATSYTMALVNVLGLKVNPADIAEWSDSFRREFKTNYVGETLAKHGKDKFGLDYDLLHKNPSKVIESLKAGKTVIIGGGGTAPYTGAGHIVYAYGLTKDGRIKVADPWRGYTRTYSVAQISKGMRYGVAVYK